MRILEQKDGETVYADSAFDNLDVEIDSFQKYFDELRGKDDSVSINVHRQASHGSKKLTFLFTCAPDDYTWTELQTKIRDDFGTGEYRLHMRRGTVLCGNKSISLEKRREQASEERMASRDAGITSLMEKMIERQDAFMERMLAASEARRAPPDHGEFLKQLVMVKELMGGSMAALPPPQSPTELLRLFMDMRNELSPKQTSPIELLKTVVEIQGVIAGAGDKDANGNDVLISLINNVLPKLSELGIGRQNAVPDAGKVIAVAGAEKSVLNKTKENEEHPMWSQLMYLVGIAKTGKNPETYANLILDQTPENRLAELHSFASNPGVVDEMVKICSAVSGHREWFAELARCIVNEFDDEENESENAVEKTPQQAGHKVAEVKGKENLTSITASGLGLSKAGTAKKHAGGPGTK